MVCPSIKPLFFIGTSHDDLKSFPEDVQGEISYARHEAQLGLQPYKAKVLQGFGGASVLEVRDNYQSDAYRAVYTVKFENAIYVLHCFQKKSKRGSATTQQDMEMIRRRLREAQADYEATRGDDEG